MAAATALFAEDFAEPILRSKRSGARHPEVVLARRQAGNPVEKFDAQIAATALAAGAASGLPAAALWESIRGQRRNRAAGMRLLPRRYQLGFASTRQRPLVALTTSAGCPEAAAGPSVAIGSRAGTLPGGCDLSLLRPWNG